MDVALEKSMNEVKAWLQDHDKKMSPAAIQRAARRAMHLYIDSDYERLEDAVEDVLLAMI